MTIPYYMEIPGTCEMIGSSMGLLWIFHVFFQLSGGLGKDFWSIPTAAFGSIPPMPTIFVESSKWTNKLKLKTSFQVWTLDLIWTSWGHMTHHDTSWHQSQISSLSSSIIHPTASKPAKTRGAIAVHRNFGAWVHPWVFSFLQGTTCWNDSCKASWDLSNFHLPWKQQNLDPRRLNWLSFWLIDMGT